MAGLFDDLIPGAKPGAAGGGMFADLIPAKPKTRNPAAVANDWVIEAANAAAGGVKSVADFVAPGNAVSSFIEDKIIKPGEASQSDAVKFAKAKYAADMEAAGGIGDEIGATLGYAAGSPGIALSQAVGSFVLPGAAVKGGGMLASLAGAGAKGATRGGLAGGAVAGAALSGGDAAGTAYELVMRAGGTEEQASEAARKAAVLPAAIGAAGGVIGAERLFAGAGGFKGGMLSRALKTAGVEGAQEAVEEGVTQYEGQAAAVPFDPTIDPLKGVAGAATMGAVLGGATGGAISLLSGDPGKAKKPGVADILGAPDLDKAIDFSLEAVTAPTKKDAAPLGLATGADGLPFEADPRFAGAPILRGGERPAAPVFGSKQQADIYIGEQALFQSHEAVEVAPGRWQAQPTAATRALLGLDKPAPLPTPDARELSDEERQAYANKVPLSYSKALRNMPQPEVSDSGVSPQDVGLLPTQSLDDEGNAIPAGEAQELYRLPRNLPVSVVDPNTPPAAPRDTIPAPAPRQPGPIPTGEATEFETLPVGEVLEGDLLARDGQPFGSKTGAQAKAYASGGGRVVPIPDHFGAGQPGYVVRPLMQARPNNTRGTDARDLPRSSNVNQPDVAGTAGQPVADGAGRPDVAVGGELAAGRVASDATGQQPGTAAAVAPGSAGNAPAGAGNAADAALSDAERQRLLKKWPGIKDKSDEALQAQERWDAAQSRLRALSGYRGSPDTDIQQQVLAEFGGDGALMRDKTGDTTKRFNAEWTRRMEAEADRLQAEADTPGTLPNARRNREDNKRREETAQAMQKATQQDIDANIARLRELERQGRITPADAVRLLELAQSSTDAFDAAMKLEGFVAGKSLPADTLPVGRQTDAANAAPTFTEGQRVQLAGQSYTVTTVNGSAVKLQGADGITKMVARKSKTFGQIQPEAATAPAEGPGSDAGNGFKQGPKAGERYRVGVVASVGGAVSLEKRLPAGTAATFYVGKDGNLIDGDSVNLIGDGKDRLWIPATPEQAQQAQAILDEMGRLELNDPARKDAKARLKALVQGKPTQEPNAQQAPAPRTEATAPTAATATPASAAGTGTPGVEADGLKQRYFASVGITMTMPEAAAKVKELEAEQRARKKAAASAPSKILQRADDEAASRVATLARKLRDDIKQFADSFPDARAELEQSTPGVEADGVKPPESALRQALRSVGIDPDAPRDKAKDKATTLRKRADALMTEARKMLEGIPPGQPVRSTRDANLRERAREKTRKAGELYRQADELETTPNAAAPASTQAPAPVAGEPAVVPRATGTGVETDGLKVGDLVVPNGKPGASLLTVVEQSSSGQRVRLSGAGAPQGFVRASDYTKTSAEESRTRQAADKQRLDAAYKAGNELRAEWPEGAEINSVLPDKRAVFAEHWRSAQLLVSDFVMATASGDQAKADAARSRLDLVHRAVRALIPAAATPNAEAPVQAAPAVVPGTTSGAVEADGVKQPDRVKVMTRQGQNVYVERADLESDKPRMRHFTSTGKSLGLIVRENLDPTGELRRADAKEAAENPLFDAIGTKDGRVFASEAAAARELSQRGLKDTHEVAPEGNGFIVKRRAPEAAPQPTGGEAAPAPAPEAKAQPVAKQAQPQVTRFVTKSDMVGSTVEWQEQQASGDWMRLTTFDTMQQAKDAAASRGYDAEAIPRFVSEFSASAKRFLQAVPEAAPAERTPKAQAVKEKLAGDRQPFEHAGLKVYPTKMRRDGAVVDAWAVQLPENKGTDKVLGDTLHTTIEAAKESAEYEAKRESDRKQWERKDQEEAAKREAAKEANRGKSVAQRAADFSLNQPNKLPPSAGLGTGTRRDAMDKAVEQGRAIRAETVEDTAAKNRDKKAVEAVSKAGYLLGLSNENIPVVKAGLEARDRLKADKYPKIEYRVYGGRLAEGPFHTITKIEHDYAVQRQAEQFAAEQDRPAPAAMQNAPATHKDPGEPAEPVTPAVVREAIKTGVQATDRKPSAMKADLLQQIDDAVKEAPDYPDFEALVKQRGDKEAREFFTMRAGVGEKAAPEGYSRPKRTFRVEGDGVFTVNNTVRQLLTFRASVESSPGFKDRQAPAGLTEKATTALDRRSTDAAIANMVDEGDFQAALDYAEAKGVDIGAVKLTKLLRDRLEKWQKDQASAKAVADYEAARAEGKPAPGSLAAAFAEKEAEAAPAPAAEPEADDIPEAGIASQTFDQWVRAKYAGNEYKARYLEEFGGDERRAILGAAIGTIDNDRKTPDLLKAARAKYMGELLDLPRETSISLDVWDALDNFAKVEAQRHFYDLDRRITRRTQDETSARVKAEREKKAPYEAAFAEVDAEIRRLDAIPGPETQKQKDLSARRERLREALYQIGQGKEPDGRLLRKETPAEAPAPAPAAPAASATLEGPRRDPTKVSMFNPYINGDIVTIGGKDWMLKQDMPGWYLTSDGTWRGEHPTIKGIRAMMDLIREVEQAAQESIPAPATQAAAILDAAAEPPKGAERLSVLKDVKSGAITPEEVAAAFPPAGEVAAVEPVAEDAPVQAAAEPATKPDAAPTEPAPMPAVGGISMSLAQQAHSGTSFVPERRAEQERDSFRGALKDAWDRAARIAGTDPAAIARITEVFADVADGYRARYTATLQARSRVMSAMIAGPARFPVERNRKRMETERKRAEEASEFLARGIKRLIRAARGPIDNSPESELERVRLNLSQREELQETMKAANAALRKDDDAALEDLGFTAEQIADLKKGSKWDRGFPAYRLTNNNAEIRRLRERLQSAEERMAAAQAGPVEKERQGVKIVEDATDDRLRLIFDGKPSEAVREDLKANGFKWSPKNDAWQRQLTDNARYAAKQVLDKHYPADDAPAGGEARFSRRRMTQTERADNFSVWGGSAPVVDREQAGARGFKTGEPVVVEAYHGTARPDRVGTVFQTKRATSGPMAFFTSDPTLASSYAQGKEDTSIGEDYDGDYSQWFKVKTPGRRAQDVAGSWWSLTPEQRDRITNLAPRVVSREDDDGNTSIELADEGTTNGVGNYEYEYRKSRNPLRALVENWLASGMLFNEEQDFLKVLKAAGFPMDQVEYDSPRAKYPFVYKTFIRMGNPLVTSDIPQSTRDALEQAAKRDRSRPAAGGADQWDKNTRTLREWVAQLNDPERGSYAWTSIPDKVTDVFKSLGYDGIVDWSGKGGGNIVAPVYIPFTETQVKSAIGNKGTFDPDKKDILYSRAPGRSVELEAADAVGREFWRKIDNGESFTDQEVLDALSINRRGSRRVARRMVAPADITGVGVATVEWQGDLASFGAYTSRASWDGDNFNVFFVPDSLAQGADLSDYSQARDRALVHVSFRLADDGRYEISFNDPPPASTSLIAAEKAGVAARAGTQDNEYRRIVLSFGDVQSREITQEAVRRLALNIGQTPTIFYPRRETGARAAQENTGRSRKQDDARDKFSRAPGSRAGVPIADAEAVADAIRAAYPTGPQIVVLDDVRKAPEQLLDQIRAVQAANTVEGAYYKGKIYLFPQNVSDIARLMFVGAHHEIRHAGLDALFGKKKNAMMYVIAMRNPRIKAAADEKKASGLVDSMVAGVEEVLADMPLEDMAKLNGWNKIVAAVRQWLRGMADRLQRNHPKLAAMIRPDEWTDNDVAALIRRAEDISRGGTVPARPGGAVFSRADQTQTPAFRRWFGDSKVVKNPEQHRAGAVAESQALGRSADSEGAVARTPPPSVPDPLVVYHGTRENRVFTDSDGDFRIGKFSIDFTEFSKTAKANDGGFLGDGFYFSDADVANSYATFIEGDTGATAMYPVYLSLQNPLLVEIRSPADYRLSARDVAGHDGVIATHPSGSREYVAFRPEQIKSAIGNNGDFNPGSSDIRFSRAGTAKTTAQRQVTQAVRNTVADMLGNAGAKVSWWDKTLGTQYAKAQKFPAYKRVFDAVQQYLEDTSAMANEAADQAKGILPKLETWKDLKNFGLKPADAKAIAAPIFEGTLTDQKVYDDAELAGRFKLTPAQIAQYKEFRAAVNTSLDQAMAAEALRMLGDKNAALRELALTDREALRAGVLQYLYQQAVKAGEDLDAQGDERGEFTKLRDDIAEKYDRIDSLKAQGYAPLMRFGQYKLNITDRATGQTLFFGLYESKAAANAALRDMQGDPTFEGADFEQGVLSQEQYKLFSSMPLDSLEMFAEAIGADQSDVYQDFIRLAKSNRSAMKRLLKRKGTAGFSEDVPRVLAAFVTSNARMAAGALNMPTAKEAAQDIRDGDVQDEAIKLLDVVQNPTDTAGAVRGLMFTNFIGGSIASAVVNLTQPLTMTLPYLSQFGGGVKAAKRLMAAGKMAATGRVDDLALRVALKRAETDGIVSPQEIHHLQAQAMGTFGTHPLLQRAAFIWGAPFSLAEQFNRRVSFIAAFNTAREQGIDDPFGFAEKAVIETQGLYSKANAPNLARGTIGAAALTFKQFGIHYLEWMGRMWKSGPEGKKAVALALALLILAAGTDGLPFADDLDDLIDTLGQALGYDMNVKRARREFVAEQLGMGDTAADVMARGFSAVPGIPLDVSIRMSMGNLLPGTGMFLRSNTDKSRDLLEVAGPAGGLAKQYIEAGTKALKGDFGGAVQSALPVAFQNAFKGVDMWTTGEARDTLGRKVMDADAVDGLMKFIGFQPQAIARESEKIQMIRDSEQLAKNVEGEIASAWARAIVDKDPDGVADARAKLAQWNEDNPESPIRIKMQQIITRAKKLREDRASRFITSVSPERRRAVAEALD